MITLGGQSLPDGLRWQDEHAWSPVSQAMEYTLTGSLVIDEATKRSGRPITLEGGLNFAWMTKGDLEYLVSLLSTAPETGLTLTLHDGRQFQVLPRHGTDGAVTAHPVPRVLDSGLADPDATAWYYIEALRLLQIG